jgi:MFS family permease
LSDIFGRQELVLVSLLFFTVGSVVCGVANTFTVLLAGRCVQGIGGGGIITMSQVIFADIIPLRQRPKWFAIVLGAWALGSVLGPLVGGLFVQYVTWRWTFYINLPFCGIGFVMVPLFVKLRTEKTSLKSKLLRVDWLGGFLFIGSLTSFLIAVSWGGVQFAWSSFQTLVPLLVGIAGVTISLFWERYGAREPFLRKSLFHSPSAIAAYICALVQGLILFCALYYGPFYFMSVKLTSPTTSGVNLLPVTCFLLPGSAIVSILITRLGHFRWAIWTGWVVTTTGCGLLRLLSQNTSTAVWATAFVIFGLGNGIVLSSVNFGIQSIAHTEDSGRAASMYAFMRTLGMTIGVAVGGTVFQNFMSNRLEELGLPTQIAHDAEGFIRALHTLAMNDPTRIGALKAYVEGFHGVFEVITGISGLGLLASLVIKRHSMDKILESRYSLRR